MAVTDGTHIEVDKGKARLPYIRRKWQITQPRLSLTSSHHIGAPEVYATATFNYETESQ